MIPRHPGLRELGVLTIAVASTLSCSRKTESGATGVSSATPTASASATPSALAIAPSASVAPPPASVAPPAEAAPAAGNDAKYAWLASEAGRALKRDGTLESRFKPPPGYTRIAVEPGSFGEWLRGLPMAPADTAVTRFDGSVARAADDEYVAGVLAVDLGSADLQQSADALIRLHAEWLWSKDARGEITYPGSTKLSMPLSRWEKGQRIVSEGANVYWAVQTKPAPVDYAEFRRYLDHVFTWANSASLARRAERVEDGSTLVPGDFFLHTKPPGHVAIVLDVAAKPNGDRVGLIGQALSPAESIHVVRPGRATAWFTLRPGRNVLTPHSAAYGWDELRRMPVAKAEKADDAGG